MTEIKNNELKQIKAGGVSVGLGIMIVAGVIFIIGVIDGYVRPLKCN